MAEAIPFHPQETVIAPAPEDVGTVRGLRAVFGRYADDTRYVVSCWQLSPEEMVRVVQTGCVFHCSLGTEIQPMKVVGLVEDTPLDPQFVELPARETAPDSPPPVPDWAAAEIRETWLAARDAGSETAAFRLFERMSDRLGWGRTANNPSLVGG